MKDPSQFIYDWAFTNNHKIFVNLDKENYWLVSTFPETNIYNFECNSNNSVPDYDFDKIRQVMSENGYQYAF